MLYGVMVFGYVMFNAMDYGISSSSSIKFGLGVMMVCVEKFMCLFIKLF